MKNPLKKYAFNKFSQFGEDGIINHVFETLPVQEDYWCVEFGAWDGEYMSNTHELVAHKGWKGIYIEGNKNKFKDLQRTFKRNSNAVLLNEWVHFEGPKSLDSILSQTELPQNCDLVSIDIDGNDFHVWESLKKYQAKLVVIEFNQSIPSDIEFVQERDFSINHGNSLSALIKLGESKGYKLIATTLCNGFFIQEQYYDLFNIEDNSIRQIWDSEEPAPKVFELFDGTLSLSRSFDMRWSAAHIGNKTLQIIPKPLRCHGDSPSGKLKALIKTIYLKFRAPKQGKKQ
jgi:hypothetical protein